MKNKLTENENRKMAIIKEQVLNNLRDLIGEEWNEDNVICCFEDCYGDELIITSKSCNSNYDYIAYADLEEAEMFLFRVDQCNVIKDVWKA